MDESMMTQREKDIAKVSKMRLMDDSFMRTVFNDYPQGTELILNILLGRNDLTVEKVVGQREVKNPEGKYAKLDIHAIDSTGKNYDVEIQRSDYGAGFRRARYNSSLMDTTMLPEGVDHHLLNDAYVIFITEEDVFKAGLPIYHIERVVKELDESFEDGSHIMYVNNSYQSTDDDIGKLMHDFRCTTADDMYFKVLADRVKYFKESEGGQASMCRIMENERKDAAYQNSIKIAIRLIKKGEPLEEVAEDTDLPLEKVQELAEEINKKVSA